MGNYYQIGSVASTIRQSIEKVKQQIRDEAAKGARPAAKAGVMPVMVGVGAVSLLSLIIALRK